MKYLQYLPDFLHPIRDFEGLGTALDPETESVRMSARALSDECFADTASLNGITRFESMFGISPNPSDSLEQRRFRVLTQLRNLPPFSIGWLYEKLRADYGEGNYSIRQDPMQMQLHVLVSSTFQEQAFLLFTALRNTIPAAVVLKMGLLCQPQTILNTGVLMQVGQTITWKEDSHGEF
ncbi:MAG: putative phage tail protein [Candidatus Merdivicinus sp.]|jgi:hypothetical protein